VHAATQNDVTNSRAPATGTERISASGVFCVKIRSAWMVKRMVRAETEDALPELAATAAA
jgi:hypothetical protein